MAFQWVSPSFDWEVVQVRRLLVKACGRLDLHLCPATLLKRPTRYDALDRRSAPGAPADRDPIPSTPKRLAEVYHFHSHDAGPISLKGVQHDPWPLEASGFEMSGAANPSPSLKMGNVGFITALCLEFDDMVGAKLTCRRTLK